MDFETVVNVNMDDVIERVESAIFDYLFEEKRLSYRTVEDISPRVVIAVAKQIVKESEVA